MILLVAMPPTPEPRHPPLDPRIFWPIAFIVLIGYRFLSAALLWSVEIDNGLITLGWGRNRRRYRFEKIACVDFRSIGGTSSMVLEFRSGKRVEIFIDAKLVKVGDLQRCFESAGISVRGEATGRC